MPMMERIEVLPTEGKEAEGARYDLWGQLVKKWAREPDARPKMVADMLKQCAAAGVNIKIPGRYHKNPIQWAPSREDTLMIRLPPPVLIADAEKWLPQESGNYPLPPFYQRAFQGVDPIIGDKKTFHDERVGDYSMGNCA